MNIYFTPVKSRKKVQKILATKPSRISASGSMYWSMPDGSVFRYANHWGLLRSDSYNLRGREYGDKTWVLGYAHVSQWTQDDFYY